MKSISDIFFENVKKYSEKTAIICDGEFLSYKELASLINKWSNLLISNDVKYGEHIGVLLPNDINFVSLILASANIGAAIVPLNPTLPPSAIEKAFDFADVKHIIGFSSSLETLNLKKLPKVNGLLLSIDEEVEGFKSFKKLFKKTKNIQINTSNISGDEPLILTMTSGSTGEPKPIVLTQKNKIDRAFTACSLYSVTESDKILAATPLYHSLAERLILMPLLVGATSVLMPRFSPSVWLECIKEQKITFTIAVSSQLSQIAELIKEQDASDINSLRCIVSSSALLQDDVKLKLLSGLECDIHECYGTSEVAIVTNLNLFDSKSKLKTVGKAIPDVDVKILKEDKSFADLNEPGEIICKTPMLFAGYYKLDDLTKKSMFGEYFCTGDIGKLDENGFLTYLERKKDLIITGGINVYPKDIEEVVLKFPNVKECAAVSFPDEKLGETVAVVLLAEDNQEINLRELKFHCAKYLADFQQPRKYFVMEKFPKTGMGKLRKHALVEELKT